MGLLTDHPIAKLRRDHRLSYFVETGTWRGDGITAAAQLGFVKLWTIEASPSLAIAAADRIRREVQFPGRCEVLLGDSSEVLGEVLEFMRAGHALWWLDAHLPERYGCEAVRLPLELEVLKIVNHPRGHGGDVFLIDDWRLYGAGTYGSGSFPGGPQGCGAKVQQLLAPTHDLEVDRRKEGCLVATPKSDD